jgi:hypothetical protein
MALLAGEAPHDLILIFALGVSTQLARLLNEGLGLVSLADLLGLGRWSSHVLVSPTAEDTILAPESRTSHAKQTPEVLVDAWRWAVVHFLVLVQTAEAARGCIPKPPLVSPLRAHAVVSRLSDTRLDKGGSEEDDCQRLVPPHKGDARRALRCGAHLFLPSSRSARHAR